MYSACTASHMCTQTHTQTYILHAQPLTHARGHTHIHKHMFCMHNMCIWTHPHVYMNTHTHSCQQFLSFKTYPCSISQVITFWGVFWYAYSYTSLDKIRGVYVTSRSHIHLIHFIDLQFICHEFICFPSRNWLHSSLFSLEHQFVKELHTVIRGNLISEGSKEGRLTFQFQRP